MKRKCLILKDAQGGLCGYLIQEDGRIVLSRRTGADRSGTLVCVDAQGRVRRLSMEEQRREMQWADEGGQVEMVFGENGGELIFVSGEDAKRAYLSGRETENTCAQDILAAPEEESMRKEPLPDKAAAQSGAQEARWPPPPCLMGARYCGGVWQISGEG